MSRFLVLATIMYAMMTVLGLLWPGDRPMDWVQSLVTTIVITLGLVAGSEIAMRRYGREALKDEKHPQAKAAMWTEIGVMVLVVAVAILIQKLFFQ